MTMPRFSAEASLYQTGRRYYRTETPGGSCRGPAVLPQLIFGWEWGISSVLSNLVLGQLAFPSQPYRRIIPMQALSGAAVSTHRRTT
jgi:hypothetical protein